MKRRGKIQMLVDLLLLSVLAEQSSQNPDAPHPEHLVRDACPNRTFTLAHSRVSSSSLRFLHSSDSRPRVQMDVALDDEAVLEELADVLAYARFAANIYGSWPGRSRSPR